ncbi:alpha/beta-hydrolase [Xylariomycetidae sp. FL2044]|nr:alpha/beta-hydrolase [Xylariomycetidae sp. FL2044]
MAASSPFTDAGLQGYESRTFSYKTTPDDDDIKLDVVFPSEGNLGGSSSSPRTVLLHYHGGFLVLGDRYTFRPTWLLKAAARRGWVFVTPDYRLMPESTAQSALADAVDAYAWVLSSLGPALGFAVGPVLVAGSSAGGYLALATTAAASVSKPPAALLLTYGMLDPTNARYLTPGTNIFGHPAIDTAPVLATYPKARPGDTRKAISGHPVKNPAQEPRSGLIAALHLDALFLDYMTGVDGLGRAVADRGLEAVPAAHRNLFPLAFATDADLAARLPPTMLLHGRNDSAVPLANSMRAEERLRAAGVDVRPEFPDNFEHGTDSFGLGSTDVEAAEGEKFTAYQSLRRAIAFLAEAAS